MCFLSVKSARHYSAEGGNYTSGAFDSSLARGTTTEED